MPRLDVTFKKGPVPKQRNGISGIRLFWHSFVKNLEAVHISMGDKTRILEAPLWQITESTVSKLSADAGRIYIPHKMRANWYLDERVYYYMQMVIPSIFSIDPCGWCATSSNWPISESSWTESKMTPDIFDQIAERINSNKSKFQQPKFQNILLPEKYILFPCQIPHDETIKYHSDVSVENSLECLITAITRNKDFSLVVKSHPANIAAMKPLHDIFQSHQNKINDNEKRRLIWIDQASIHELIQKSTAVFTVNSGVGLEALLHSKRVYTFGNADYASAAEKIVFGGYMNNAIESVEVIFKNLLQNNPDVTHKQKCRNLVNAWYYCHYDCDRPESFEKIRLTK